VNDGKDSKDGKDCEHGGDQRMSDIRSFSGAARGRAVVVAVPGVVFVFSAVAVGVLIGAELLGPAGEAGLIFCEASRPGWVKQPANAWSNAGFVVAGFLAALWAWRDGGGGGNRMRARPLYPALYASVAVFLGPGSFALHATTTVWGGKIDVISMYLWAAFAFAYACTRLRDLDDRVFVWLFAGVGGALVLHQLTDFPPVSGTFLFGVVLGAYALLELVEVRRADVRYDRPWLWIAGVSFAVAFAIWLLSRTGAPLCDPHSLLQGHAAWHLLNALAMFALFRLYCSERRVGA